MVWPEISIEDFPPRRDDEPSSLRQDILDELSDHFACALNRELLKCADERLARRRVIDRFGDPIKIARQLWLEAMKERIMSQRIMTGISAVMAACSIAVVGIAWMLMKESQVVNQKMLEQLAVISERPQTDPALVQGLQQTNEAMMRELKLLVKMQTDGLPEGVGAFPAFGNQSGNGNPGGGGSGVPVEGNAMGGRAAPAPSADTSQQILKELERLNQKQTASGGVKSDEMNQISFQLVKDNKDKDPAVGFSGTLSKTGDKTDSFSVEAVSDDTGKLEFGRLPWGKYSFLLHAPWGEYFGTEISVIPGRKFSQTIVCPVLAAERVPIQFEVDWSDQLRSGDWLLLCDFRPRSFSGGAVQMDRQVDRKTWWRSFSAQDWASQPQVCLIDRDNQVSSCPLNQNKEFAKVEFSSLEFQPTIHLEQSSSYICPVVCLIKKTDLAKLPSLNENQKFLVLRHERKELMNMNPFSVPLAIGGFGGPLIPTPTTVLFPFEKSDFLADDSRNTAAFAQGIQLAKQLTFTVVKDQDDIWKFKLPELNQLKIPSGLKPVKAY